MSPLHHPLDVDGMLGSRSYLIVDPQIFLGVHHDRIEPYEIEQIAEALRIKREKAARNELHDLKLRLARLEASLSAGDADFHRPSTDYYRDTLRELSGDNRPVAKGRVK